MNNNNEQGIMNNKPYTMNEKQWRWKMNDE